MKVLISAYACEPDRGSEPGVGWNWIWHLSKWHEIWAITRGDNKEIIEKYILNNPLPNVRWIYLNIPIIYRLFKKGGKGERFYYVMWQAFAYFTVRKLHQLNRFDLVHHATFVNYWLPTFLVMLPIPYIWGPVGGGDTTPKTFYKLFSFYGQVFEISRKAICHLFERSFFVRITAKKATLALATTKETAIRLEMLGANNVRLFSQVALADSEIKILSEMPIYDQEPFRIISIGILMHWKGFSLALHAFSSLQKHVPNSEYWIVGDGSERRSLEKLALKLGISKKVRFLGMLQRKDALLKLQNCSVLLHPSFHDSGGWVCAEAMSAGLPVVCLDLAGPALQVTEKTGFKIRAGNPDQTIVDISDALLLLSRNDKLRVALGKAARDKIKESARWVTKAENMNLYYNEVLS